MDFRAGLILVCTLFARASCKPVSDEAKDEALTSTIESLMKAIRSALHHLSAPELLPNTSCSSLNMTEQLGPEQQPLAAHISTFRCYMQELSELIPELSKGLKTNVQLLQNMENLQGNQTVPTTCSLPSFEQQLDFYVYAKCFLQLVQKRLTKSK